MNNNLATFKDAKARIEQARKEAKSLVQTVFTDASTELFNAHPELDSFGWRQYTPYFNDGDTCEFSARTDEPAINGIDGGDIAEGWTYKDEVYPARNPELIPLQKAVEDFLGLFDDDDFLDLAGDHVEVTVSREGGLTTDDYSHD